MNDKEEKSVKLHEIMKNSLTTKTSIDNHDSQRM